MGVAQGDLKEACWWLTGHSPAGKIAYAGVTGITECLGALDSLLEDPRLDFSTRF